MFYEQTAGKKGKIGSTSVSHTRKGAWERESQNRKNGKREIRKVRERNARGYWVLEPL